MAQHRLVYLGTLLIAEVLPHSLEGIAYRLRRSLLAHDPIERV